MWTRVTGASAPLAIVVAFLFVFSLSDVGISRSLVLEENTSSSSSSIRMVGPRLEFFSGQTGIQNFPDQVFRNLEKAEKQFAYISGLDLSEIPGSDMLPAVISPVQLTEKEMIDQAVLRVAYAQYLVSLLALKEVAPTAVVLARQEVKPDEILAPDVITAGSIKVGSTVPDVLSKEGIEPVFMDIVAPLPRVQSLGIENRKESVSAADLLRLGFTPVPVQVVVTYIDPQLVAPIPAPASSRPVLAVRPAGVGIMREARDVSADRLVHVNVQGSWPRRLDRINSVMGEMSFVEIQSGQRVSDARTLRRLPNGMFLVVTDN